MIPPLLAHIGELVEPSTQSQLLVFGTATTASITMAIMAAASFALYSLLSYVIRKQRGRGISELKQIVLARIATCMLLFAMASAGWDIWWHRAMGRDTFWIPPHIALYSFVLGTVLLAEYGWFHTRNNRWKHLANILLIVPIIAPFDNLWHVIFGVENLAHPINLVWAPPHLLLNIVAIVSLWLLLPMLHKAPAGVTRSFFNNLVFGALLALVSFIAWPFHPTEGWGQVAGFWGAGVLAAIFVGFVMTAQRYGKSGIDGTLATMFSLLFFFTTYGKETAPGVILIPHDRPPIWLLIFAFMAAGIFLDITKNRLPVWIRGGLAGALWAGILFGFSKFFFQPQFSYTFAQSLIAIFSALVAGALITTILTPSHLRRNGFDIEVNKRQ